MSVPLVEAALLPSRRAFPAMSTTALAVDMARPLPLPPVAGWCLFFYPGSSIGNFTSEEALALPTRLHAQCAGQGGALIGSDLDPAKREYKAFFNAAQSLIEMHLRARCALMVHWDVTGNPTLPGARNLAAGGALHTENSVKYTAQAFTALLYQAGLTQVRQWTDTLLFRLVCGRRLSRITS